MIKVLYNALHLSGQFGGVQHTEEQLLKEAFLHPEPDICLEAVCPYDYRTDVVIPFPHRLTRLDIDSSKRWQRIGYEHFGMSRFYRERQSHILHCPAYILPWNWKEPGVVTVHDLIALDYPEYCATANRTYFRWTLPRSIRKASKIIAVSYTVKDDILRRFPVHPDRIEVIYPGVDDAFRKIPSKDCIQKVKMKYRLPEKFILFVGNIEPKKNIVRLIDAYLRLIKHADIPHSLVIAGRLAWKYHDVLQKRNRQPVDRILFPGYVDASELPALYSIADLFVFPSLYEGFGIPPLEAMTCGVPVIVSHAGALSEVTGRSAYTVNPFSVESITKAMYEVLHNNELRTKLVHSGRKHVEKFTWKANWEATANVYRSIWKN